jgi:hypothetical protein
MCVVMMEVMGTLEGFLQGINSESVLCVSEALGGIRSPRGTGSQSRLGFKGG